LRRPLIILRYRASSRWDTVLGDIFDDMTWVARNASQYVKLIAYHDAANAVAGANRGGTQFNKCYAYYQLHHFQEAVDECTQLIGTHRGVLRAHYYRAWANEALRNYDAALEEYADIAQNASENSIRAGAVINLGHINALQGKISTEREIFEKYPFVFNVDIQSPEDLAIIYNNRCFVCMKMGEPKKALDDCNISLKYGRLPDALHKQQELLKQLSEKST
jgi:tetratricopeptide (TPR) repeat protein